MRNDNGNSDTFIIIFLTDKLCNGSEVSYFLKKGEVFFMASIWPKSDKSIDYIKRRGVIMAVTAEKMEERIAWMTEMDEALNRAREENKPILLDFFNPN